jgi:hypothetical protein
MMRVGIKSMQLIVIVMTAEERHDRSDQKRKDRQPEQHMPSEMPAAAALPVSASPAMPPRVMRIGRGLAWRSFIDGKFFADAYSKFGHANLLRLNLPNIIIISSNVNHTGFSSRSAFDAATRFCDCPATSVQQRICNSGV